MRQIFINGLFALICGLLCAHTAIAQFECLSPDDIKRIKSQVDFHLPAPFDKKLSEQLIKLKGKNDQRLQNDVADNKNSEELVKRMKAAREKNGAEMCQIMKTVGWPSKAMVGEEATNDAFFLLRDGVPLETQVALLPAITSAVKQGELSRRDFAAFVDLLRLKTGSKQLFGTQATLMNGFLVLFPIEAEAQVDVRRKQYGLEPLAVYLRTLEHAYRLPLIKSTGKLSNEFSAAARQNVAAATNALSDSTADDVEVVRVETNLVNLNVSVYNQKLKTRAGALEKSDFSVSEDGTPQEISYFGTTDVPFDLVLLIDLSGSTEGKRDLIQKATEHFIDAARPSDRIGIITFADEPTIVTPLTDDRQKLRAGANALAGTGGSNIWHALDFTLKQAFAARGVNRRRAVVFITDGLDNSMMPFEEGGPTSFAELLETVRRNDALIIPIWLSEGHSSYARQNRVYESAGKALELLADESGGLFYQARNIGDLRDVYGQVIDDLGKVYSLGYRPTNERRDGSWRTVNVTMPAHPDLKAKARPGYYAN
jgi:VWFA-related protein